MMLWLTIQFLFAGLVPSDSTPILEDCQQLVTPLSLKDHSMFTGTWYFIEGFTDHEAFKSMLKMLDACSYIIVLAPNNADVIQYKQENKFHGTCYEEKFNATINHDTGTTKAGTMHTVFQMLPTCSDCLLFNINITFLHFHKLEKMLGVPITLGDEKIYPRFFYLMAKKTSVKEEDLQHFRKQAACAGFSGDPDYHYDPSKEFCGEDEGQQVTV